MKTPLISLGFALAAAGAHAQFAPGPGPLPPPGEAPAQYYTTATMSGTTAILLAPAPGSGLHLLVSEIDCNNASPTTGTSVQIWDGNPGGSGGSHLMATQGAASGFGGFVLEFSPPVRLGGNNALYVQDFTGGASVICNAKTAGAGP